MVSLVGKLRRKLMVLTSFLMILWLASGLLLTWSHYFDDLSVGGQRHLALYLTVGPGNRNLTTHHRHHDRNYEVDIEDVIIYNRVPKCASTSMRLVMKALSKVNKYNIHSSRIYSQESLNDTGQKLFVEQIKSLRRPLLFVRHIFFVDFTRHNFTQPTYINMIRDPLERLISDYYFKRYNVGYLFPMSSEDRDRKYTDCVQDNYTECVGDSPKGYFRIIPYFCGQDPYCFIPSDRSLVQAKQNVENHFLVVGVIDYVREFLEVLEKVAPRYFRSAPLVYEIGGDRYKHMARTKKKDQLSSRTVEIMKTKLRHDYDFYRFIRNRFINQYKALFDIRLS
ncbi:hypothetical protein LSH36_289g03027 [Paralvinella palmiformis]|uniref:Uronyl 2-sulfotransferase n=1 Tax=Paralvinella palmiformis TaxID=53620 RepID=A0AAD9JJ79_9ANNE|nr:hypothetical protein LSH36_289g03027 [Paralvinella palmiformis]